jgi:glycosyltransferase involved in cell wall biosynthesis
LKFLFVHQNFPGQFLHIVRHLVEMGTHEIVFITEANANQMPGVRKIPYLKPHPTAPETHIAARELDSGVRRAEIVAHTARSLKQLGFNPDIIIGHHGWGEMLNLVDVYPGVPMVGYMEFYYQTDGADVVFDPEFPIDPADFPRIRAKNAINHIALNLPGRGVTPTKWQLSTYPEWARPHINLLWEGVHLDLCETNPTARHATLKFGDMTVRRNDTLVTYVSRDLEPYRGVHTMIRALPHLLRARKNLKVVMLGGDGVSYGVPAPKGSTWRDTFLKEVADQIDPSRISFPGRIDYAAYLAMLKRSDAHVYLTYPFVASWSLREALASGCLVVGSDTEPVREFITHGRTGLLTSFFDPCGLADSVLSVLEDKKLDQKLRAGARHYAERHLGMDDYLLATTQMIETLTGKSMRLPEKRKARTPGRHQRVSV